MEFGTRTLSLFFIYFFVCFDCSDKILKCFKTCLKISENYTQQIVRLSSAQFGLVMNSIVCMRQVRIFSTFWIQWLIRKQLVLSKEKCENGSEFFTLTDSKQSVKPYLMLGAASSINSEPTSSWRLNFLNTSDELLLRDNFSSINLNPTPLLFFFFMAYHFYVWFWRIIFTNKKNTIAAFKLLWIGNAIISNGFGGGGTLFLPQGFDPMPTQSLFCTILRYPFLADWP